LRKLLIGLALVLIVMLGTLAVAPRFIDPARLREIAEAALHRISGRPISIAGPVTLSLLPSPVLTARDVRLVDPNGAGDRDLLRIAAVELRLAVPPLLQGRLVLARVTLANPVLTIERSVDGRLSPAAPDNATASAVGPKSTSGPDLGLAAAVARLDVVDGTVTVQDGATAMRLTRIHLTATAPDSVGPFHASASGQVADIGFEGEVDLDRVSDRMPFHLLLRAPAIAAQAEIVGDLLPAAPSATGKLKLSGDNLATLLERLGKSSPSALARPFQLSGDLDAASAAFRLQNAAVTLGDIRGTMALRYAGGTPGRASVTLALNRIDLDAIAASPPHGTPTPADAATVAATIPLALAAAGASLPQLHAEFDVALEALLWRGGTVREARLQATLDRGALTITRATAQLPGGSDLSFGGTVSSTAPTPQFRGALEGESDNLRELAGWLGVDVGSVPADRLRKASLTSHFAVSPDHAEIEGFDLTVDATRVTGAASIALRQRLAFGARLAVDRLNLDAYLPQPGGTTVAPPSVAAPAAEPANSSSPVAGNSSAWLTQFDANLDATIDTLTWRGQPARGIHVAGTLQQGELTVREAGLADLAGASGTLRGTASGLTGATPTWHAMLSASGPGIDRVVRLLAPSFDRAGRLTGAFSAEGQVDGEKAAATGLDLTVEALGGAIRVTGRKRPDAGPRPRMDVTIAATHPSFAGLARRFAPLYQPRGGDPGEVALSGRLHGTLDRFSVDDASLTIGGFTMTGDAAVDRTGARPKLSGALDFADLALDPFLPVRQAAWRASEPGDAPVVQLAQSGPSPAGAVLTTGAARWSHEPYDLAGLDAFDADLTLTGTSLALAGWRVEQPALSLSVANGALEIGRLSGGMFDGVLEASGRFDCAGDRRQGATIELRHAALDRVLSQALGRAPGVDAIAGTGDLAVTLSATGCSPAELVGTLGGSATLNGRDGTIRGIDVAALSARLTQPNRPTDLIEALNGLQHGSTRYAALAGTFAIDRGVVRSEDLRLVADAAEAKATLTADLISDLLRARAEFRLTQHPEAPPFAVRLDGDLQAPRVFFDINALETYLSTRGVKPSAP
jgi:uncharacterized protein involved in outer membrane biogenesis